MRFRCRFRSLASTTSGEDPKGHKFRVGAKTSFKVGAPSTPLAAGQLPLPAIGSEEGRASCIVFTMV
jgi:hypothetical protein